MVDESGGQRVFSSLEVCAGAGGQALGLEAAGFEHLALVEYERWPCATLKHNRPDWNVVRADLRGFTPGGLTHVDLLAAGVPCPPFSVAGKQLGADDDRDLFPEMLRLAELLSPSAVMIENVRGLLEPKFDDYRRRISRDLASLGYEAAWRRLDAADFGVPQLRPRVVMVALRAEAAARFEWPQPAPLEERLTVGDALHAEMASLGWEGADEWRTRAASVAPTLVGGSRLHGGPDLGPTRARQAWAALGVNGKLLAAEPPAPGYRGMPYLTVRMAGLVQGFPADWEFKGPKTHAYRQVGNAFPPAVAEAVALKIRNALDEGQGVRCPRVEEPPEVTYRQETLPVAAVA